MEHNYKLFGAFEKLLLKNIITKGDVYIRDREAFLATIFSFFIVAGCILDMLGQMGASLSA